MVRLNESITLSFKYRKTRSSCCPASEVEIRRAPRADFISDDSNVGHTGIVPEFPFPHVCED